LRATGHTGVADTVSVGLGAVVAVGEGMTGGVVAVALGLGDGTSAVGDAVAVVDGVTPSTVLVAVAVVGGGAVAVCDGSGVADAEGVGVTLAVGLGGGTGMPVRSRTTIPGSPSAANSLPSASEPPHAKSSTASVRPSSGRCQYSPNQ
jgi:hypothetical protein